MGQDAERHQNPLEGGLGKPRCLGPSLAFLIQKGWKGPRICISNDSVMLLTR